MKPTAPMLAVPMSKADIRDWNDWMMEEKFDGWRLVVTIPAHDPITAHTRLRKHAGGSKDQNDVTAMLPADIMQGLDALRPRSGWLVLDGELLAIRADGTIGTSTDVPRKDLAKRYVVFDVLMTQSGSSMMMPYAQRRNLLETLVHGVSSKNVVLADARPCVDSDTVAVFCHEVWDRGGEGLILKNRNARYEAGKRREAFVKIKKLFTAVIKVTGFEASRGTVLQRGQYATVVGTIVEAPEGHESLVGQETSVKTKDDAELAKFNARKGADVGRLLRIEYQDIAAEGGVRHPRWDRWENE
jgi:ATP-dependent DNA ligase